MTLRSIPRLRSRRVQSSSMRAATRSGFTFVGAQTKKAPPAEDTFTVKTIPPNKEQIAIREDFIKTLAGNRQFWKEELIEWEKEFGEKYVEKLKAQLKIAGVTSG